MLTTSWPTVERPWAGHFVSDLAKGLASRGHRVSVCALAWEGEVLSPSPGVSVRAARLPVRPRHLPSSPEVWPLVLGALHRAAMEDTPGEVPELWVANWWPTAIAAPPHVPCLAVLHGSDVDLAERLPDAFVGGLTERLVGTIAVAPHLAERFKVVTGIASLGVVPLGAALSVGGPVPKAFRQWARADGPRVLSVGRDVPGKGLDVARAAAARLEGVAWAIVTPDNGVGPAGVRALLRHADVLVVPSKDERKGPSEGRPHVLAQALVAGVVIVGGPNRAVRQAVRAAGQIEVIDDGPHALAAAVRYALGDAHAGLRQKARSVGHDYRWPVLLPEWERALASGVVACDARATGLDASR